MNHETAEVVAPIEYDLEQVVHRGDAAVAVGMQAPPDWRIDVEEQEGRAGNCVASVWLEIVNQDQLSQPSQPRFSRSSYFSS